MITNVYVDGFNLYYGCLKGTNLKWLDLDELCGRLLPAARVKRIRYFTAKVSGRPDAVQAPVHQNTYLRALATRPRVSVHLGQFLSHRVRMPLAAPGANGPRTVEVTKTEEKGSDVNLATFLVADAFRNDAEQFVIISNDSDLREPLRLVAHELNYRVGILNPHPWPSQALLACKPAFCKQIRKGVLAVSQFPTTLQDAHGTITKPADW